MRVRLLIGACAVAATLQAVVLAEDRFPTSSGELVVRPLAHASVRLDFGGRVVYVDPWSGADLSNAAPADVIVVTDADAVAHHLDPAAIQRLRKPGTTVVMPASGKAKVPDGVVLGNGERRAFGDITIEAIAAYDLIPVEPFHAKGVANGYVITFGGTRVLFAGVTECVPELRALGSIDVAFVPMNLPNGRMTPEATSACVAALKPKVAYPYHYDQGYIARLAGRGSPEGAAQAAQSVRTLAESLKGQVEVRAAAFYPAK